MAGGFVFCWECKTNRYLIDRTNASPILNIRVFEDEFSSSEIIEMSDVIAKSLDAQ